MHVRDAPRVQMSRRKDVSIEATRQGLRRQRGGSEMKRTTHRSASGKKLYAVRDAKGRFKDIQTFKRAHGQDVKRKGKKER